MNLSFSIAKNEDVPAIATLRTAVAERLLRDFGPGHWSVLVSEQAVLSGLRTGQVVVAREGEGTDILATFRLSTQKPWAIDPAYFTDVRSPLYLTDMAVAPEMQGLGIGRDCLAEAARIGRAQSHQAIRLDAYDAAVGAGPFYEKCGFREMGRVTYRQTPLRYYEQIL